MQAQICWFLLQHVYISVVFFTRVLTRGKVSSVLEGMEV